MKNQVKYYWKEVIEALKNGKELDCEIDFNNESVDFKDAALLNRNGFFVPEQLVAYNDDDINFSDDPEISESEIQTVRRTMSVSKTLPLDTEIKDWIERENIDIDKLIVQLIKNFYNTITSVKNNAAL